MNLDVVKRVANPLTGRYVTTRDNGSVSIPGLFLYSVNMVEYKSFHYLVTSNGIPAFSIRFGAMLWK